MKHLLIFIFLLFSFNISVFSQNLKERIFHSHGSTAIIASMPAFLLRPALGADQLVSFGYGYNYNFRLNIFQLNNNNALAIETMPSLSLSINDYQYDDQGIGGFHIPLMLSYHVGLGSTYDTESKFGMGFSAGFEYNFFNFYYSGKDKEGIENVYFLPTFQIDVKYWGRKSNKLRSIFLRISPVKHADEYKDLEIIDSDPIAFKLGWMKHLNY